MPNDDAPPALCHFVQLVLAEAGFEDLQLARDRLRSAARDLRELRYQVERRAPVGTAALHEQANRSFAEAFRTPDRFTSFYLKTAFDLLLLGLRSAGIERFSLAPGRTDPRALDIAAQRLDLAADMIDAKGPFADLAGEIGFLVNARTGTRGRPKDLPARWALANGLSPGVIARTLQRLDLERGSVESKKEALKKTRKRARKASGRKSRQTG